MSSSFVSAVIILRSFPTTGHNKDIFILLHPVSFGYCMNIKLFFRQYQFLKLLKNIFSAIGIKMCADFVSCIAYFHKERFIHSFQNTVHILICFYLSSFIPPVSFSLLLPFFEQRYLLYIFFFGK